MVASVVSHSSVGGPSTQLNRVAEGGWWLTVGLSILRPSRMSCLVMVTNSLMAKHSSFTLSARGQHLGLSVGKLFLPYAANFGNRPWLEVSASATHLDIPAFQR